MKLCACGRIMPKGAAWCYHCYMFWSSWWLRIHTDARWAICPCADCKRQRQIQPVIDEVEQRNAHRR